MPKHSAEILKGATLLLAGHGSSRPDGDNPIHHHATAIRTGGLFATVREGYLKQPPLLVDVAGDIATDELFVVPMLTGRGYITDDLIPGALEKFKGTKLHICEPVGSHPETPGLLTGEVASVINRNGLDPVDVSVLLAAHGNRQNPENAHQIKTLARAIADKIEGIPVNAAFIEEPPLISNWQEQCKTEHLVVLPFLIGGGLHGAEDVPAMLGLDPQHPDLAPLGTDNPVAGPLSLAGRKIWYCRTFGEHPALTGIIVEIVQTTP